MAARSGGICADRFSRRKMRLWISINQLTARPNGCTSRPDILMLLDRPRLMMLDHLERPTPALRSAKEADLSNLASSPARHIRPSVSDFFVVEADRPGPPWTGEIVRLETEGSRERLVPHPSARIGQFG
jgi:hypothetical protein